MLMYIINYMVKFYPKLLFFFNLKFRIIASFSTSIIFMFLTCNKFIFKFNKLKINQVIRPFGPKSHIKKCNTPTMGGILIILSIFLSTFMWSYFLDLHILCALFVLFSFGILGFIDDYYKIYYNSSQGIKSYWKYFWQSIITLIVLLFIFLINKDKQFNQMILPVTNWTISLDFSYFIIIYFVIVGTSNAVNLTDGLDGLAIIPIITISLSLTLLSIISGNIKFANYFNVTYLFYTKELSILCVSVIGSGLGFLWFNSYPAQIFMGDIGSLSIGGMLGTISVLLKQEFLMLIVGGICVLETISVFIQIFSLKLRNKKIFKMTPVHHHFELKGLSEPKIVVRFWIISVILLFVGLSFL